jgi:AcrR family transcriptional regulator
MARRALILEVARARIAEVGVAHTSVRDIAAACGLSTGTVTYHFKCLDEILCEALRIASEEFITRVVAQAEQKDTVVDRLGFIVDANLPDRPDALALWRMWLDYWSIAARGDQEIREVHAARYGMWRDVCEEEIRAAVAAGEIAPIDVHQVATEFIGLFDGLVLQAIIGDRGMSIEKARSVLKNYLARTLIPVAGDSSTTR